MNRRLLQVAHRAWVLLAALSLLALGLTSCRGRHDVKSSAAESPTAVVEQYVDAVRNRQFDAAMDLQCSAGRVPTKSRGVWLNQLDRFTSAQGMIGGAKATTVPSSGAAPLADLPGVVEVSYTLTVGGRPRGDLIAVTVIDGGRRRLCGRTTPMAKHLFRVFSATPKAGLGTALEPKSLLPPTGPDGHHLIVDKATQKSQDSQAGERDGWTRVWQRGDYGGIRATAIRFDTQRHALDALRHSLLAKAADSVDSFSVPSVSNALGMRLLGYAWLGVQPPDLGPYVDYVYAVFGKTLVVVGVADLPAGADHQMAANMMTSIAGAPSK